MLLFILFFTFLAIVGAWARLIISKYLNYDFPFGTLFVNIIGCFLAGFWARGGTEGDIKTAILIGFLGALTTFSSFSLQVIQMLQNSQYMMASVYFFITNLACLCACFLGIKI